MIKAPLQVIGAGPAGMSLVLGLCNRIAAGDDDGSAQRLLDTLHLFEADPAPGGAMGRYRVNANTSAHDAVRGIADGTPFVGVRDAYLTHPQTQSELIPLPRIDELMVRPLAAAMGELLGVRLHCDSAVARIEVGAHGIDSFADGDEHLARSESCVLCCGAREIPLPELLPLRDRWEGSARFLLRQDLDGLPHDPGLIVIIGASHSAFSCAWRLLHDPMFAGFARDREIVILKRRERVRLRCTPEFAAAHDIDYDSEHDLCPTSGLVFRNGGLRKDAKQLYLQIRDGEETRVQIIDMNTLSDRQDLLERASLVLQATGFAPRLPLIERDGEALEIGAPTQDGELTERDNGAPVPGLYGLGLGLNILPDGPPRGEASFAGGIHGFQSYPLSIAPRVIDRLATRLAPQTVTPEVVNR